MAEVRVAKDSELLEVGMRMEIGRLERNKNIKIMWKALDRIGIEPAHAQVLLGLDKRQLVLIHERVIGRFQEPDYIIENGIRGTPTNKEFVEAISEEIRGQTRRWLNMAWVGMPTLESDMVMELNLSTVRLLKNPELCNLPKSQIKLDRKERVGVLDEKGKIVSPEQKISDAIKIYFEKNLAGVKIPIDELETIRVKIQEAWESKLLEGRKPSKFKPHYLA